MKLLYCYDGEENALAGGDPYAIILHLSDEDARLVDAMRNADENVGTWEIGGYVNVTDQATGDRYEVATAPCGSPCHCAAVAKRSVTA